MRTKKVGPQAPKGAPRPPQPFFDPEDTDVLLVDAMNAFWRVANALAPEMEGGGVRTDIAFLALKHIIMARKICGGECDILIVFEGGRSIRKKIDPEYKAHRSRGDDEAFQELAQEVYRQVRIFKEIIHHSGWGIVTPEEGYEADDGIYTLAKKLYEKDLNVTVLSNDKDLYGCMRPLDYGNLAVPTDPFVGLLRPRKAGSIKFVDSKLLHKTLGLWPDQIANWKALAGDPSDGYKGVPGVGEKTAAKWLANHRTLLCLLEAIQKGVVRGKRGHATQESFKDGTIERCFELARLRECKYHIAGGDPSYVSLVQSLKDYEMKTMLVPGNLSHLTLG